MTDQCSNCFFGRFRDDLLRSRICCKNAPDLATRPTGVYSWPAVNDTDWCGWYAPSDPGVYGLAGPVGPAGPAGPGGATGPPGGIGLTVKVSLSAAQLRVLHSSPVEIVAAPGAGKAIVPVFLALSFTAGAAHYTSSVIPGLYYNADTSSTDLCATLWRAALISAVDRFVFGLDGASVNNFLASVANKNLAFTDTADAITGDGTAVVTMGYTIVDTV